MLIGNNSIFESVVFFSSSIRYMRLHINEIFNQSILNHIRERILFLFKQQPDSAKLIRHSQNQFSQLLEKTIEKYCGTT
jgi:hypothetical protein